MDPVRFGRVLGVGARLAAKTVVSAVDAATSPDPRAGAVATSGERRGQLETARPVRTEVAERIQAAGRTATRAGAQAAERGRGLRQGGKRFGEAVWGPVVKLSGVLWLEVTGVFFGLFALSAGVGAWRLRGAWRGAGADHAAHTHLLVAAGVAVVFGYFCVTSFARAHRRGKGR